MTEKWRVISDTTVGNARTIVSDKISGEQLFTSEGKLIVGPRLPDIPAELKKRCPQEQIDKWDKEREAFSKQMTEIMRAIA